VSHAIGNGATYGQEKFGSVKTHKKKLAEVFEKHQLSEEFAASDAGRLAISSSELMPLVQRATHSVDPHPQLALAQVRTLQDVLDRASAQMAFTMVVVAIAASVALMLGVIGIFGVMSYVVTLRDFNQDRHSTV
jgi:hypothetical protein